MIEYFDVVDAKDVPTGKLTTKSEAHAQGIVHRCVAVYVFDPQGRLYMQPHMKSKGLLDHSVGGHVSSGEDYATAARREGEEELGLHSQSLALIAEGISSDENFEGASGEFNVRLHHMFGLFESHPDDNWNFEPNDEVGSIVPETIEKIVAQMNGEPGKFTPGFINTMSVYLQKKNLPFVLDVEACRRNWGKTRV